MLEKTKSWIRAWYNKVLKCLHKKQTTNPMRPNLESGHWPDMGKHEHGNHESY